MDDMHFIDIDMDFGVAGMVPCRIGYTIETVPVGIQSRVERQEIDVQNVIALKDGELLPSCPDMTYWFEGDLHYIAAVVEQQLKENAAAVTENYAELRKAS